MANPQIFSIKTIFCLKLDAKSVPETLATSIRILLMFSIVLAHSGSQILTFLPMPIETEGL